MKIILDLTEKEILFLQAIVPDLAMKICGLVAAYLVAHVSGRWGLTIDPAKLTLALFSLWEYVRARWTLKKITWIPIFAAVFMAHSLSACAQAPVVMGYDGFPQKITIIVEDSWSVEKFCDPRSPIGDDGAHVPPMATIEGCANRSTGTIHISREHPEILTHELAHLAGVADPDHAGYAWP